MATLSPKNPYTLTQLNKGARFNGYKDWFDPALRADGNALDRILRHSL